MSCFWCCFCVWVGAGVWIGAGVGGYATHIHNMYTILTSTSPCTFSQQVTQNVCVKEVGKFRHRLISPADQAFTYVIVDVILVGRTKIITLHSGLWLTNRTQHTVGFRLHLPISGLVPPQLRRGSAQSTLATDRPIGPLLPGQGTAA